MSYRGPTFVNDQEYAQLQTRRFDEMTTAAKLPSEPLRVQNESARFDDLTKATPPPSAELHNQLEGARFDEMAATAKLPSAEMTIPEPPAPYPGDQGSAPPSEPSGDAVQRTLDYLRVAKAGPGEAPPDQPPAQDRQSPDAPPSPTMGLVHTPYGPMSAALPWSPLDSKPVAPSEEEQKRVLAGEPFTPEAAVSELAKFVGQQGGQGQPAGAEGMPFVHVGTDAATAEQLLRREVEQGAGLGTRRAGSLGSGVLSAAADAADEGGGIGGRLLTAGGDSKPGVVYHDEINLPKGPSDFKKYWDRSRNVLASMGAPGQEIADRVHAWRDGWKDTAGDWATRMPDVWSLSKQEFSNLVDVLEAKAAPVNDLVAQARVQAKAVLDDVYALAQNAGVDVAGRIEDYFPHRFDQPFVEQLRDSKRRAEVAQSLLESGQAATVDEAKAMMQRFVTASRDRRNGSLEMERLSGIDGYAKTKDALIGHLVSSAKRIHEVAQFGRDDAIVNRLFQGLQDAGYDPKDVSGARDLFQVIVNAKDYEGAPLPGVASGLRKYNAITRLGWAGISNATQGVNTATVAGVVRTLQSVPKAIWSQADKDFALRAGVTLDNVLKEMRGTEGQIGERLSKVAMPGFAEIEKFNRTLTAIAGRDFAIDQAAKAAAGDGRARRALTALGLDADAVVARGGKLDAQQQRVAARNIDERTQFQVDPQDLPGWANSPWGKVVTQFGSFSYNQSAFVWREVVQKALEGDTRPLVRFAILAPLAQAAATETRNLVQGRDPEESTPKRVSQYVLGPLGKVGDAARAVLPINSDRLPPERQAAMVVGQLLGPSVGAAADLAGAGVNLLRGNTVPAERTALRQLPVVGTQLQNYILPYGDQTPEPASPPRNRDSSRSTRDSSRDRSR